MTDRFRIASYNIHKAQGMDGRTSIQRIARVLHELKADVIALQEVVTHEGRDPERNQSKYLADALGFHYEIGEARKHLGGAYGNVTLSRWPLVAKQVIDISIPGREPRCILRTDLHEGERHLHIFNAHLGTAFIERRRQAERLLKEKTLTPDNLKGARIVLGDFNEWTHGMITKTLRMEFKERDSHRFLKRGYPGLFPLLNLDHCYCDHHLNMVGLTLHRSGLSLLASDHLPLVVDVQWE